MRLRFRYIPVSLNYDTHAIVLSTFVRVCTYIHTYLCSTYVHNYTLPESIKFEIIRETNKKKKNG